MYDVVLVVVVMFFWVFFVVFFLINAITFIVLIPLFTYAPQFLQGSNDYIPIYWL